MNIPIITVASTPFGLWNLILAALSIIMWVVCGVALMFGGILSAIAPGFFALALWHAALPKTEVACPHCAVLMKLRTHPGQTMVVSCAVCRNVFHVEYLKARRQSARAILWVAPLGLVALIVYEFNTRAPASKKALESVDSAITTPAQPSHTSQVSQSPIVSQSEAGEGNFRSIGEAVRNAQPGSRIRVQPGTYTEKIILDKNVEIVGDGPISEIILDSDAPCIFMKAERAAVRGLTIRGRVSSEPIAVIGAYVGELEVDDCDIAAISDEQASSVVMVTDTGNPVFRRCSIHGGTFGVAVLDGGKGLFEDCVISGNSYGVTVSETGVRNTMPDRPLFRNCRIVGNREWGIMAGGNGQVRVERCDLRGNGKGSLRVEAGSSVWANGPQDIQDRGENRYVDGSWSVGQ